jgi:peptide/nickel transport system permease protein
LIAYVINRAIQALVALFVVSIGLFLAVYAIGNPVDILMHPDASEEEIRRATEMLGLDQPLWLQYFTFLGNIAQGDLGTSFFYGQPALDLVAQRLPATLELACLALFFVVILAVPLGLLAGLYPEAWFSRGIMGLSICGFSLPNFWLALMLLLLFSVSLGWLPSGGRGPTEEFLGMELTILAPGGWQYMVMPALVLSSTKAALVMRLVRAGVRETIDSDYIRFARAKGLPARRVIGVHLMRNIMIPVITVLGMEFGQLVAATIVTETIFAWPGLGKLLIDSLFQLDRPVLVAVVMTTVTLVILINLAVDLMASALDPRLRRKGRK